MKLILASHSLARAALMEAAGYQFTRIPSDVPEPPLRADEDLESYAVRLAELKAREVSRLHPDSFVLGADTILYLDHETIGKPADLDDAFQILKKLGGRTHELSSGICVVSPGADNVFTDADTAHVTMREWSDDRIRQHVELVRPLRFAGAYALQGEGAVMVKHLDGDPNTVIGLPMGLVEDLLDKAGYRMPDT
ncbi:MAG: septum formation protein Maf [Verrucomicrobia bacterium]|nr:septum formation protein Maf [Verrucomicrobiota bacterium]